MAVSSVLDPYEVLQVRPDAHAAVVQAAFRALAALRHPDADASAEATARMAELNIAYAMVRTPEGRSVYEQARVAAAARPAAPLAAAVPPPPNANRSSATVDFGRYTGWSIADLARRDPDYLQWLSRHSSGICYRAEIVRVLQTKGR